jgi:hypothetical protein
MVLLRIIDAKLSMSTRNEFAVFIWILGYPAAAPGIKRARKKRNALSIKSRKEVDGPKRDIKFQYP